MDFKYSSNSKQQTDTEYEQWFRKEVKASLNEAKRRRAKWIPHEVMLKEMAKEHRRLKRLRVSEARKRSYGTDMGATCDSRLGNSGLPEAAIAAIRHVGGF